MKKVILATAITSVISSPIMAADLGSTTIKTNKQFSNGNVEGWFYTNPDSTQEHEKGHASMTVKDGNKNVELSFYRNSLQFRSTRLDEHGNAVIENGRAVEDVIYVPTMSYDRTKSIADSAAASAASSKADKSTVTALQNQLTASTNAASTESNARQAADTQLDSRITTNANAITAEANARQAADTQLDSRITNNTSAIAAESDARKAADTQLDSRITNNISAIAAESDARKAANTQQDAHITANANAITAETNARQTSNSQLNSRITTAMTDISNNTTSIEELYSTTADHEKRITDNSKRISKVELQVQDLYSEVKRLDGAIAAATAVGSMVTPRYDGDTVISVGIGHYNDTSALAFGATHNITEHMAIRATVAGSDADSWSTPIVGASANWAF